MKNLPLVVPLLLCGWAIAAQVPNRGVSKVIAPAQPPPAATIQSVVQQPGSTPTVNERAAIPTSDPLAKRKEQFVGKIPATALTITYPPGGGEDLTLETHNLTKGDDGYYFPTTEANSFVMKIPQPAKGMQVSITCAVRGQPRAIGSLHWLYSNGGYGGGVDFAFPAGESESHYQTNFNPADPYPFPMTTMWITLPPNTGIRECRIGGMFEQHSQ